MARDKSAHHEKIITAAREEFMTYGFTAASMRRIAAAAGMSVAGLYKHFTSKEEMFAALVEPACQGLISLYRLEVAEEQAALQTESLGDKWSQGGDAKMAMVFIYDHLDAFRLLICKSAGTRYESFLHDLSEAEEKNHPGYDVSPAGTGDADQGSGSGGVSPARHRQYRRCLPGGHP